MAQLLGDIEWGVPILAPAADAGWEAEIKRRGGRLSEVDRRVVANPWLREACLRVTTFRPTHLSQRLANIGMLVTSQENACRYCYGANRAYMKILGYSESFISQIERDAHVAELDDKERAFIAFCRNLARSRPRPARADRDALIAQGFAPLEVAEAAFLIALGCFYNRVSTLIACPSEQAFERLANGWVGRLIGLAAPVVRALTPKPKSTPGAGTTASVGASTGPFGAVVASLNGVPGADMLTNALDGALASTVLPHPVKALMFAVVGRTLGCARCEDGARQLLAADGIDASEVDSTLATLDSARLSAQHNRLLSWVRDTVHYQTATIQNETRALASEIGQAAVLEAIGVAALANATVRLAMLQE